MTIRRHLALAACAAIALCAPLAAVAATCTDCGVVTSLRYVEEKGQASGETTPEEHTKLLDELYGRLATAPDEATATQVMSAIEQLWLHSGSATADLLVARASAAIEAERRDLAMKLLNAAVELQPDFAEAWNRRAYLFYLEDDYKRALGDIRRVLALEPNHYKALEGLANILQQLGESDRRARRMRLGMPNRRRLLSRRSRLRRRIK